RSPRRGSSSGAATASTRSASSTSSPRKAATCSRCCWRCSPGGTNTPPRTGPRWRSSTATTPSTWSRPARSAASRSTRTTSTAAPAPGPTRNSAACRPATFPPDKPPDMARALIVGCGCSGRALGSELLQEGWAVRGTSRDAEGLAAIEAAGIEPARADPEQPGTILELVDDVAVLIWLLGSATGAAETLTAIHGPRLESLLERLVET